MKINTTAIDRIKSLRRDANAIGGFHKLYSEKFAPDSHCDKKGYGFGRDNRFAAFKINVTFNSYAGYYGNSSCSTILSVSDNADVEKAFVKALNLHQKELFATAARLMREEAASLADEASKELAKMQEMLDTAVAEASDDQLDTEQSEKTT